MGDIAIIPARGGSKRLPGKNIKLLGGKPLIEWTIAAALESECFEVVLVSTDDRGIAELAISKGAHVPFIRPKSLASDTATSDCVIEHAIDWLENTENVVVDNIALLQPTSPFRNAQHIKECYQLLVEKQAKGIVSVAPCDIKLEICNLLPADKKMSGFLSSKPVKTQDMAQLFILNGAIYLFNRKGFKSLSQLYEKESKTFAYIMSKTDSVDIDTELDFLWAEFILENLNKKIQP